MEGQEDNYIYPSAGNPCILRCLTDSTGTRICTLFLEHTYDTMYVQLAFTDKIFTKNEDSVFRCDYMEPRDGGLPFLQLIDVLKVGEKDLKEQKYAIRMELAKQIIEDPLLFDVNSLENEFRVRAPPLYRLEQIEEVFSLVIPNFYGVAHGVAFTKDGFREQLKNEKDQYVIRKTRYPEIYELSVDGVTPIPGNNVAYVPTLELSRKLREFLSTRNSAKVKCTFHADRQKWVPLL